MASAQRDCGDGSLVLQSTTLPMAREAKALIEGDNGALLMATGVSGPFAGPVSGPIEGLKQLVDGKIRGICTSGDRGQFTPTRLFRSKDGGLWIGTRKVYCTCTRAGSIDSRHGRSLRQLHKGHF